MPPPPGHPRERLHSPVEPVRIPFHRAALPTLNLTLALALALTVLGNPRGAAQEVRIESVAFTNSLLQVHTTGPASAYLILRRGDSPIAVTRPVDLRLGTGTTLALSDPESNLAPARFYRIEQRPIANPSDLDGDGIDDVWELRHRRPGAALNPADAGQDQDGDGRPDLDVYTESIRTPAVRFEVSSSTQLIAAGSAAVQVTFSRPYQGALRFSTGGDALAGRDYRIIGAPRGGPEFEIPVNGQTAELEVQFLDSVGIAPNRLLVLNLMQLPATPYRLSTDGPTSHRLTLTEARIALGEGRFIGSLTPTNNSALGPMGVRVAIRAVPQGAMEAVIETIPTTILPREVRLPASMVAGQPVFTGTARGTLATTGLGRPLTWTLSLGPLAPGSQGTWSGGYRLDLAGLTATGRTDTTLGTLALSSEPSE